MEIKEYNPREIEEKWSRYWIEKALYHVEKPDKRKKFSVVIPPPNVTGSLHMGHALNATLQDVIVRWQRMRGRECVWVPGFDHAGIATQYVVEKQLAKEGKSRLELGREEFLKKVWEWVPKSRNAIRTQLTKLGVSVDWKRERFTLDEGFSRAVRKAFRTLFEEGLIYRAEYIVNWCPNDRTALSDLEVEYEEEKGSLWYIKYPIVDENGKDTGEFITVATTRPETMLGDTAVAVNPNDDRYKHLVGKRARLPLVNWERKDLRGNSVSNLIPIIADERVKMDFGTGAVKITPAHDPLDFEIGKTHDLPFVRVIDETGRMNENAGDFAGMDRYEAREAIVAKLREDELLEKEEEITHSVGHCYRCKTVIEPMVSVQWFVKVSDPRIKDISIKVVEEGIKEREEKELFVQLAQVEELSVVIPLKEEGRHKIVVVLDKTAKFLVGKREGELAYIYYPKGDERTLEFAKRLAEEFKDYEFMVAYEGLPKIVVMGNEQLVEPGSYLFVYDGKKLDLYKLEGEKPKFLKTLGKGEADLEVTQKSIQIKPERIKKVEEREKRVKFIPEHWKKFYLDWMYNLKDWCISRQIWWGHRIPVWYCKDCGNVNVFTDDDFDRAHDKIIFNLIADGKIDQEFTPEEVEKVLKSPHFVHPEMTVLDFYKKFVFHRYYNMDITADSLRLLFTQDMNPMAMLTPGVSTRNIYKYDSQKKKWKMVLRCKKCGSENLEQERDVLDTWFSSALWPFGVFGWPESTEDLKNLYPTDLLVTGFDIIFFWVARMIMMGTHFMKDIPFYDVYVHALVRDKYGRKMSKTIGNVIDPLDIIERYGADALRFTLAILTVQGRDIKLAEEKFEGYKHFANKIWNAARYVLMNTPEDFIARIPYMAPLKPEDKWIITKLNETAEEVNKALENYQYSQAAHAIYEFFWSDYCDWYIEFTKERIYKKAPEDNEEEKAKVENERTTALYTLHYVLEKALRILHPFMPYITEELWHKLPNAEGESISLAEFPQKNEDEIYEEDKQKVERLKEIISAIRAIRSDLQIKPSEKIKASFKTESEFSRRVIQEFKNHILNLAKLESFEEVSQRPQNTVATFSKDTEIYVHIEGHVDLDKLIQSYEKKREKLLKELERVNKKLSNENFLKKAPVEVVEKEKQIKEELENDLKKVEEILKVLRS
ncbi:valine--tRNA ligase [Aquifex aeolicus]|uniref:Valine--tRNA ligase n=1 Tax=Aquifex aeolicus (strain VF5) TaxID=224324 RepID=SYV_AQUAE|nr:valine--tRNA ligase [Aquifex aeolicus]O67411.1 RecName: Full=Valine--tRNA ligase; AltName: Full=Valyl-tRNA synthetase; Short=ValRS [Aquifex aeolicus VF5]AAC07375.1 valyl-tRNA synthetase [Aquifex aeolicus VF5]